VKHLLLLPSARFVPPELQTEFGRIASGMVPLGSRPALQHIAEPYVKAGYEVLVAVHEGADHVSGFLERHPDLHAEAVDVGLTRSLGDTIFTAIQKLPALPEKLVINFADTFIDTPLAAANAVGYASLPDTFRWTTFKIDERKNIRDIREKDTDKEGPSQDWMIFIGAFSIGRIGDFVEELRQQLADAHPHQLDPFYRALVAYFNRLPSGEKEFQRIDNWGDFGHLDTYYKTKKQFFLGRRFFNHICIDQDRGILRKTSAHAKKFIEEITWYLKLPKGLQHVAPRVFDYNLHVGNPFVEMEFYGYPALNDLYLFGDCSISTWNQILIALGRLLQDFEEYSFVPSSPDVLVRAMREMYEGKTRERLQNLPSDPAFAGFCTDTVVINGVSCAGLPSVLNRLSEVAENISLYNRTRFSLIHGDLCLSNILFDQRNTILRLIDPRGKFGEIELYGDRRYDLAKLAHSFEGDYDFLVNGLFDHAWEQGEYRFAPHLNSRQREVKALFSAWLQRGWPKDLATVRFIECLLFLSMVPLHADRFDSQEAFLAQGLLLFQKTLDGIDARPRVIR